MSWLAFWSTAIGVIWMGVVVFLLMLAGDAYVRDRWVKLTVLGLSALLTLALGVSFLVGQIR